ncbi:hypothetical protein [Tropicibacter oceani]|uniref:Uncharacterized protein n=1 Tax=Tropicibacter oceani TaxID=3058420 RepID=A0ABY8QDA9_9RHOB|nr:hypothetical protein [Tropicibacter oceani]WGW02599.1 hypothetical protein QF118_11670 [Tropicibacter oceani]
MPTPSSTPAAKGVPVIIRDENRAFSRKRDVQVVLPDPSMSPASLIALRLRLQFAELTKAEGSATPGADPAPLHSRIERAWRAFENRSLIILIDDRQIDKLDAPVFFRAGTVITFLHMAS